VTSTASLRDHYWFARGPLLVSTTLHYGYAPPISWCSTFSLSLQYRPYGD